MYEHRTPVRWHGNRGELTAILRADVDLGQRVAAAARAIAAFHHFRRKAGCPKKLISHNGQSVGAE